MSVENAMNKIKREMGVKKCIIIEGNVSDAFLRGKALLSLKDYLIKEAEELKFSDIIYWDRITGIEGNRDNIRLVDEIKDNEGTEYDIDDADMPETSVKGKCKEPNEIFNVVLKNLKNKKMQTLFILDWAEYLFGSNQLDNSEREGITALGKAIRDSIPGHRDECGSTAIIIANKASSLPLSFYNGNPEVSVVTIGKPDRIERLEVLKKISTGFNIKGVSDISDSERTTEFIDMMSDFTTREMIQMAILSRKEERMSFDKLFYLFKYGEKENPWEKLDSKSVKKIKEILSQRVIGQDEAITKVEEVVVKAFMGLTGVHKTSSRTMPKGVLFFVGPTGVGKTELSKAIAKFLFGDEDACVRFDMSEYAQENSDQKLIGAPPGYVGYEEGGRLTNVIREKPFSVVLFDEIEKAAKPNPRILDIFLQILEDGRLTDSRGETTYFSDTIIIFTSNLGASEVENSKDNKKVAEEFITIVKKYFDNELKRPELLGRIGYNSIVPFNFINDIDFALKIAKSKIKPIRDSIREKYKIEIELENEAEFLEYVLKGADTTKGGRDILNALNDRLLSPLSKFLFDNYDDLGLFKNSLLLISIKDNKPSFRIDE